MSNVWFQKISIPPPSHGRSLEIPRGRAGVIKDPLGMENPGAWGVQIKESSVGGVWIFSGTTQLGVVDKGN